MLDEPDLPSLVAVIDTFPAAIADTTPDGETVAMALFADAQLMARPVKTLLLASRVTAASCTDPPTCKVAVAGDTETDATGTGAGAATVILEAPDCPSLDALIETLPAATAVTRPLAETAAIPLLEELQLTARPARTLLFASRVTADSCTVPAI
jgi:hypothetical protein